MSDQDRVEDTNGLDAKKIILPSSLQRNHHNAITQIKGQECPSISKKRQCIRKLHENEWRIRYHTSISCCCALETKYEDLYYDGCRYLKCEMIREEKV